MKIGIVGYGYVGKAMYEYFKTHFDVIFYDPYVAGSCTKDEINKCTLGVVCVFTPSKENGDCDISIVESTIDWLETPLILIKSTVKVGTTRTLKEKTGKRICFSPEYIGESTYDTGYFNFNKNMKHHSFFTFGGDANDTKELVNIFQVISGPTKTYKQTDETAAEIAKYMENAFFSTKVVFCYEFEQICKANNVDFNEVRECWLLDPRIGSSHTCVFMNKETPYDGKCLPKDIKAIISQSKEVGYEPKFLEEVELSNIRIGEIRKEQVVHNTKLI
jgi:UDPglucose 6-dehydrogenase